MSDSLGSGQVSYDPSKAIIHFASPPADVAHALLVHRLAKVGFEPAGEDAL